MIATHRKKQSCHTASSVNLMCAASVAASDAKSGRKPTRLFKGGLVAMTLPLVRDLAQRGVRLVTVAPGLSMTPLMMQLPEEVQKSLTASIPFPKRSGKAEEFAALAAQIAINRLSDPSRWRVRMAPG